MKCGPNGPPTYLAILLMLTARIASSMASSYQQQLQRSLPTMYFPDDCVTTSISGFNEGLIISQRGDRYMPNIICSMHLTVRHTAHAVRFMFDHLDLPQTDAGQCEDFIQFYTADGQSGWTAVSPQICGNTPPSDIVAMSTNISVIFSSDGYHQRTGFRFRFRRIGQPTEVCVPGRGCVVTSQEHGAKSSSFNGSSSRLRSSKSRDESSLMVILMLVVILLVLVRRNMSTFYL